MGIGSARNGDLRIIAWHYPVTQNFEQPERLFFGHVAVVKDQQLAMISREPRLASAPPHSGPYINNLERSENKSRDGPDQRCVSFGFPIPRHAVDLPCDDDIERLTIPQLWISETIRDEDPPELVEPLFRLVGLVFR